MKPASPRQIEALEKFAKNKDIRSSILKNVDLSKLSSKKASELIEKCISHSNKQKNNSKGFQAASTSNGKNYRGYGYNNLPLLTAEEWKKVMNQQRELCKKIAKECKEDYPDDEEFQVAVFHKRCPKIFTQLQNAREVKAKKEEQ
jgi:hypothetical protein